MTVAEFHVWWKRLHDACATGLPDDKVAGRQAIFAERLRYIPKAAAERALNWYIDHAEDDYFPTWRRIQEALEHSRLPEDAPPAMSKEQRDRERREMSEFAEEAARFLAAGVPAKRIP